MLKHCGRAQHRDQDPALFNGERGMRWPLLPGMCTPRTAAGWASTLGLCTRTCCFPMQGSRRLLTDSSA